MLKHPRNLLRCFMTEKNNGEFPPFVWYMINERRFTNSGEGSILLHMQQRWVKNLFDNDKEKALEAVLFSDGGIYYAGDLHTRAEMFDQNAVSNTFTSSKYRLFYTRSQYADAKKITA